MTGAGDASAVAGEPFGAEPAVGAGACGDRRAAGVTGVALPPGEAAVGAGAASVPGTGTTAPSVPGVGTAAGSPPTGGTVASTTTCRWNSRMTTTVGGGTGTVDDVDGLAAAEAVPADAMPLTKPNIAEVLAPAARTRLANAACRFLRRAACDGLVLTVPPSVVLEVRLAAPRWNRRIRRSRGPVLRHLDAGR